MIYVFIIAILYDFLIGEVPLKIHPVVWIGNTTNYFKKKYPPLDSSKDYPRSILLIIVVILTFVTPTLFIDQDSFLMVILSSYIFTTTFSFGYFYKEISKLFTLFQENRTEDARKVVNGLVSRDVTDLSHDELLGCAIETTAENISDSITAPIFYFIIGGLPLAILYRVFNTLDAMIGHKDRYFYYGKIVARTDDILNIIPSRITLIILIFITFFRGDRSIYPLKILWRDRYKTGSPNAGLSMAYMAGVLRIQLTKRGIYSLGDDLEPISIEKFSVMIKYMRISVSIVYILGLGFLLLGMV
ncbi:MAG: cobalamin biosynthesis protein CobD [Candidatus Cloacimonadota bacterium]|nr:MAG: cobalamin biosynthesis protein CobD [Candidatus Cloacimonadota bacterium]PIE77881.1 MAG: cobalamin biosynthesis protein CobD [Candidatus Delongbacteria bacterium]